MKNYLRIPAALLLSMFILGCGQSGPLYVSGNPSAIQPSTVQSATEEEDAEGESTESDSQ